MIKFYYPDGDWCYRALHTVHAVFHNKDGVLMARTERPDQSEMYEFEITEFEMIGPGAVHT
jgi:hypothetical protein